MNTNIDTANWFMVGCLLVELLYLVVAMWCFKAVIKVVKKSSLSTFSVGTLVSVLWYGSLGALFSLAFCVTGSSSYYEYQKIVNANDGRYSVTISHGESMSKGVDVAGKGMLVQKK